MLKYQQFENDKNNIIKPKELQHPYINIYNNQKG